MGLIDKLVAIGDGFRSSRGTTKKYTLDEMAVLAAENAGNLPENAKVYYVRAAEGGSLCFEANFESNAIRTMEEETNAT